MGWGGEDKGKRGRPGARRTWRRSKELGGGNAEGTEDDVKECLLHNC